MLSSRPDAAVIGLARRRTLRPRVAAAVPSVASGVRHSRAAGGPLCVPMWCRSDAACRGRSWSRWSCAGATPCRRTSWSMCCGATSLPRNPANALQIQVSYLRKTLGGAEPGGSTVLETRAGGYALRGRARADRCASVRGRESHVRAVGRSFVPRPSCTARWTRSSAPWRCGGATRSRTSPDMEFARGEITRLEELRWAGDGTPYRPAASARPPRRHDRRAVRAGPTDAVA